MFVKCVLILLSNNFFLCLLLSCKVCLFTLVFSYVFFCPFFNCSPMGNTGLSIYRHGVCLSVYTPILSVYTLKWSAYIRLYWAYIRYPSQQSVTCFEEDQLTDTSVNNGLIYAQTERIYAQNGRIYSQFGRVYAHFSRCVSVIDPTFFTYFSKSGYAQVRPGVFRVLECSGILRNILEASGMFRKTSGWF